MNWETKVYLFTQWMFFISMIWFTIGLIIIGSKYWFILVIVPLVAIITIGYWYDFRLKNKLVEG